MPQNTSIRILDKPTLDGDKHFRESLTRAKQLEEYRVPWQKHETGSAITFLDSLKEEYKEEFSLDTPVSQLRKYRRDHEDILEQLKQVTDEGQEGYYAGAENVWQHTGQDSHEKRYVRVETVGDDDVAE